MIIAAALSTILTAQAPISLGQGMVITRSAKIVAGQYFRPSSRDEPALIIRGDNITVDFQKSTLSGSPLITEPDQRKGTAILVEGKNVIIRNLKVRGYKVAVKVQNSPGFMLLDSDLSYNWKQKLKSTLAKEDLSDWMSYHHNEKDEWLEYGAAVYIKNSDQFKLRNVRAVGGQCGAMIVGSNKGTVVNCDFSFLSAVGLGMYRSSDNVIMHNRIDWCVRGYSHGKWNRGQDSTGILIYEQSNRNVFAYNSVTHGGDGFFLWAGQSTMDTGEGGCNDNLLYGNDFSHAPTNGIEATFSRNKFINNLVQECWHGVWGGYSYDSQFIGNQFRLNSTAIAIEHGQANTINYNRFDRDIEGIQLWERASQPADWVYAQKRDTKSRDYEIRGNIFSDIPSQVLDLKGVRGLNVWQNAFRANGRILGPNPVVDGFIFNQNQIRMAKDESESDRRRLSTGRSNVTTYVNTARPKQALMRPDGNVRTELEGSTREYLKRFEPDWNPIKERISPYVKRFWVKPQAGGINPYIRSGTLRGRRYILVNEWGPYDFRSPVIWPREDEWKDGKRTLRFELLGPFGRWRVKSLRGMSLSATSGQVPGFVEATVNQGTQSDLRIELEYKGGKVVDYRGIETAAGNLVPFSWSEFNVPIQWRVRFWPYDPKLEEPRTMFEAFRTLVDTKPAAFEEKPRSLSYDFYDSPYPGGPKDHFATVAVGQFTVTPGEYRLQTSADDGVRMWIDEELVVDEWKYSGPTTYERVLRLGGTHRIRIEHFEIDGFAQLKFAIARK